jgi:polyhydroxybutyrate depolymerase
MTQSAPRLTRPVVLPLALAAVACVVLACSAGTAGQDGAPPPSSSLARETLTFDGAARTYYVHVPSAYAVHTPAALVISFHGSGGNGLGQALISHFNTTADTDGFIVVDPEAVDGRWSFGEPPSGPRDDLGFVMAMVAQLEQANSVDPHRIYTNGLSDGGCFAAALECQHARQFAAVAEVGATMSNSHSAFCALSRPMPALTIHGTTDPEVSFNGGKQDGIQMLSAPQHAAHWAQLVACATSPSARTLPDRVDDGTHITLSSYAGCREGAAVAFYEVPNGGHTRPGGFQYLPVAFVRQDLEADGRQLGDVAVLPAIPAAAEVV